MNTLVNKFTISAILVKPFYTGFNDFFYEVNYFIDTNFKNFTEYIKTSTEYIKFCNKKAILDNLYTLYIQGESMSEPFKRFLDVAKENDVDDTLLETPTFERALNNLERLGKDLGETAENWLKRPPAKPSAPTPTYEESAFIKPKKETTLYNVTNRENEVPLVTRASRIFKKASYSVRGFSGAATYKDGENAYSVIAGERVGFNYTNDTPHYDTGVTATYKVSNGKASIEYFAKGSVNSYSVNIFNQDSNFGVTGHYSNVNGFSSTVSVDRNGASGECSYNKATRMYKMELGAYATTGENYSNPFVGVRGRITF